MTRPSKHKNLQTKKAEVARSTRHPSFSVTSPNIMLDSPIDYSLVTAFLYATPDPLTDYSLVTASPYATPNLLPKVTFQFENLIDLGSSEEYESVDSNDNFSDDFLENDNELDDTEK